MMEHAWKIPNLKRQITNKSQIPISKSKIKSLFQKQGNRGDKSSKKFGKGK